MKSLMSFPAQNDPGPPAIKRQRTASLVPDSSTAAAMASYISSVKAFFFAGRFMRSVRIGPSSETIKSLMTPPVFATIRSP
jgi:hypothetical protein